MLEAKRKTRETAAQDLEEATNRTLEAIESIKEIDDILLNSLAVDNSIDWESLKRKEFFNEMQPIKPIPETQKSYPKIPIKVEPHFNIIDMIFKSKKLQKIQEYEIMHNNIIVCWENQKKEVDELNSKNEQNNKAKLEKWNSDCIKWEERKSVFLKEQEVYNNSIEEAKEAYFSLNPDSIHEYCGMILDNSKYPDSFSINYESEYIPETKIFIVEYQLPSLESFPTVK